MVGCWWFEAEISYLWCFYEFSLIFKFFINIHEYANKTFYTSGHWIKEMCLAFTLVPSLIVYDK